MVEWAMAHPWMTFFLLGLLIFSIDSLHTNLAKIKMEKIKNENRQ